MRDTSLIQEIKNRSMPYFRHSHHDRYHVERVYNLAVHLAQKENADLDIIKAAALLHDIARSMEDEGSIDDHANQGARMAKKILAETNFPKSKIDEVAYCIETHRFRKGVVPKTIEARILQDADRLDIIGAIGIARVFARSGWSNTPIHDPSIPPKPQYDGKSESTVNHIREKLLKIKDTMHTKTARKIAEERHTYIEQFLERLLKEWTAEI